jgi:GTP cyclohydrolase I
MGTPTDHMAAVLDVLGFAGDTEMADTASRFTSFLSEFVPAGGAPTLTTFPHTGTGSVVVRDLEYHSLCAHHLLPFFGVAHVAYRPGGRVAGLGGIAKMVGHFARRPQLQERLVEQIADALQQALRPDGLVVHLTARQMCMEMRGVQKRAVVEVTATRGAFEPLLATTRS